jgi:hypothetical protein
VSSVPTIFPQFDVATRVRGYPIQRVVMIHGPSNMGKTTFMLGLGRSFLERGHFYFHVDAEMTTPEPWVQENLGAMADSPKFKAIRPHSFEETADAVRTAAEQLSKLRASGQISEDTVALFGIDSLQKLVPKDLLKKLLDPKLNKDKNIDPMKGRGGMFQAALNTAWMRELIPLLCCSLASRRTPMQGCTRRTTRLEAETPCITTARWSVASRATDGSSRARVTTRW